MKIFIPLKGLQCWETRCRPSCELFVFFFWKARADRVAKSYRYSIFAWDRQKSLGIKSAPLGREKMAGGKDSETSRRFLRLPEFLRACEVFALHLADRQTWQTGQ